MRKRCDFADTLIRRAVLRQSYDGTHQWRVLADRVPVATIPCTALRDGVTYWRFDGRTGTSLNPPGDGMISSEYLSARAGG